MRYIFTIITLLFLVGCGGEESSQNEQTSTPKNAVVIDMELDKSYSVFKGDRLEKTEPDTEISIKKETQGEATSVKLLKGSATITRAN